MKRDQIREETLVKQAYERLQHTDGVSVGTEVPLAGRLVDLVYVQAEEVFTVEFKLADWRRALRQARDHLLGADKAFVCMPPREVSQVMRDEFKNAGIGLLFFRDNWDWPFELVIDAQPSQETWVVARRQVYQVVACEPSRRPTVYV